MPQTGNPRSLNAPVTSWAARYGRAILRDGVAAIPGALYRYQGVLDLSAQEVWLIACILAHKWDADLPHPSLKQIADRTGLDLRWLKRLRAGLCAKDLLQIIPRQDANGRQDSNSYDFGPLFARLEALIAADPPPENAIRQDDDPAHPGPDHDTSFVARYGRVIAGAGVAAVPQALFTLQATLGLTPQQIWFVCYILAHRWSSELPHPSLVRMAERTGYSRRQLQTIKDELVASGYLRVVPRGGPGHGTATNGYDFSGLLDAISARLAGTADLVAPPTRPAVIDEPAPPPRAPRRGRRVVAEPVILPVLVSAGGSTLHRGGGSTLHKEEGSEVHRGGGSTLHRAEGSTLHRSGAAGKQGRGVQTAQGRGVLAAHEEEPVQEEPIQKEPYSNRRAPGQKQGTDEHPVYSPYIAATVLDYSRELGDANPASNVTQALRLWQASGLDEEAFVGALRTAKLTVRSAQAHGVANKGAYWFRVLRDQLALDGPDGGATGPALRPVNTPRPRVEG